MSLKVIILAAGKGTRMRSQHPKVLQPLAHKYLLQHVVETAEKLACDEIIAVVGHGADEVKASIEGQNLSYAMQAEQLGTGHAVAQANEFYNDNDTVLILYGDVPLIESSTLEDLLSMLSDNHPLALLTINLDNSSGYGRIVRDNHFQVQAIVEEKDASLSQKEIKEVNTGIMAVKGKYLKKWLEQISADNAQKEYYLTDIIAMCVVEGFEVHTSQPTSDIEVLGVNDKSQLQSLERKFQTKLAESLMSKGATLIDASRLDIRGNLTIGQDVYIDVNVVFEGEITLGDNVKIGANCVIKNSKIGSDSVIESFSHLEGAVIADGCNVGPYARLRPGTKLGEFAKIGNFVEIKESKIGKGSKISHLSYVGDTLMGSQCNIGAGTITCNYDGANKHVTKIGDDVFIGSASQLVAPVNIGSGATIGAGSTITKDSPEGELTLSRAKQMTIKDWKKPSPY